MEFKQDIGSAVKSKLDHLKDSPDELVWSNIEAHLKKKKRRRGFILLFFGAFLAILSCSLWFINTSEKQNVINTQKTDSKKNNSTSEKPTIIVNYDSINDYIENEQKADKITGTSLKRNKKNNFDSNKTLTSKSNKSNADKSENHLKNTTENKVAEKANTDDLVNNQSIKNTVEETVKDSSSLIDKKVKKQLKEKTKDSIAIDNTSRWSLTPQIIGSNYGALNARTSKSFTTNYGLFASYRMNKSAYVRIGIRKLNLQQTIDSTSNQLQYLEIPLEIKYAPFHKKINPYFTGGFSYFILQDSNDNNLNSIDYKATLSINFGLGIETKLFHNFYLNFEPNFNYQLKPFTEESEIKPYILSVQTGLEYRF